MINIAEIHRLVKLRLNKVDSNSYQDFLPADIDDMINQATLKLINYYDLVSDRSQVVKDIISPFKVTYPDQPALYPSSTTANGNGFIYDYNLDNLKYPYYRFLRAWVSCDDFVAPVSIITSDEQQKLNNAYTRPNSSWGRYVGMFVKANNEGKPALRVFANDNQALNLRIEYIKMPKKVYLGGYDSLEYIECKRRNEQYGGTEACNQYYKIGDPPVDSELGKGATDLLVDMTVYLLSSATENQLVLQIVNAEMAKQQSVL